VSVEGSKVLRFPRTIPAPAEPRGPEVGDVVAGGRYVLLECLGVGGLGTVFLADDLTASRRVAIKTLVPRYIGRREREQRLFDEFRYLERVKDRRHVVEAIECGRLSEFDGWPFMVMEHVDGLSLFRRLLQGKRMTPAEIIELGLQTARGIQAIHRARVVHRDITPQNLLLTESGKGTTVKIIDFSHGADADARKLMAGEHGRLTGMHEVPGTAQYMPPEQANAKAADPRMDIYSFGIVLHEMITGRNPFAGMTRDVYIDRQRQDALQVDPLDPRVYPDLPESLLRLVGRCLRENPAGRPAIELVIRRFEAMHVEVEPFEAARTQPRLVRPVLEVAADESRDAIGLDVAPAAELGPVGGDLVVEAAVVVEASAVAEVAPTVEVAAAAKVAPAADGVPVVHSVDAPVVNQEGEMADPSDDLQAEQPTRSPWLLGVAAAVAVLLLAVAVVLWVVTRDAGKPQATPDMSTRPVEPAEEPPEVSPAPAPQPSTMPDPADTSQADDSREPKPAPVVNDNPSDRESQVPAEISASPEPRRSRRPSAGAAPKAKARCEGVVEAAKAARIRHEWTAVVKLTADRGCWAGVLDDRLAWRAEALSELGRWEECAQLGAQTTNAAVKFLANGCLTRSKRSEDAR
jgi:hypothetical protein